MDDLDKTIATLIANGPDLRRAGYQSVQVGAVSFTLHPPEPVEAAPPQTVEESSDPLNVASTYGLAEGSKLPGFPDPRKKGKS